MVQEGRLDGKAAIVTGAASGFGKGIAERFAAEGASVVILDINEDAGVAAAEEIGNSASFISCDLTSSAAVSDAINQSLNALKRIDIVVNNAGWSYVNKPLLDVTEDEFDRVYAINVKSIFNMTRACVPPMRQQQCGSIINIGSTAGMRPRPGLTWYNGSKGAVNTLSKSLAAELAPDKIRVNCLAPVLGETALMETFMGGPDTPESRAKFLSGIPLGRLSTPRDIANAALYFASDEADFITGVVMEVDGGRCI